MNILKSKSILTIAVLILCVLCTSCDGMSPKFMDISEPFIVHEIKDASANDAMIWYYCKEGCNGALIDKFKAPKGMFNIGDTVAVCKYSSKQP